MTRTISHSWHRASRQIDIRRFGHQETQIQKALYWHAEQLLQAKRFEEAADFLLEQYKHDPTPSRLTHKLLFALRMNGKSIKADQILSRLQHNFPGNPIIVSAASKHARYAHRPQAYPRQGTGVRRLTHS